ncbi:Acetyl-coenzyme A synthetase, cytoplasmic, variant 3 [Dermatophagoides farinae]|uniref:Acetyl-coenzyme A synthetase, cytoplasmic, variant 3 n=1 Tax=Dermatophagoides farinae TaxID=6954 RepID=A0A922I237_DERFA|nr:Acetyl-coenzyme A synthetase, cytoplasmic, variant 3 [Dermatophagoides farinae]
MLLSLLFNCYGDVCLFVCWLVLDQNDDSGVGVGVGVGGGGIVIEHLAFICKEKNLLVPEKENFYQDM